MKNIHSIAGSSSSSRRWQFTPTTFTEMKKNRNLLFFLSKSSSQLLRRNSCSIVSNYCSCNMWYKKLNSAMIFSASNPTKIDSILFSSCLMLKAPTQKLKIFKSISCTVLFTQKNPSMNSLLKIFLLNFLKKFAQASKSTFRSGLKNHHSQIRSIQKI